MQDSGTVRARNLAAATQEERLRRAAVLKIDVDLSFVNPDVEETLLELEAVAHVDGLVPGHAADSPAVLELLARLESLARETHDPVHLVQFLRHVRLVFDGPDAAPSPAFVAGVTRPLFLARLREALREPPGLEAALRIAARLAPLFKDAPEDAGEAFRGVARALAAAPDARALEALPDRDLAAVASALRVAAEGGYADAAVAAPWRAAAADIAKRRAAERRSARHGRRLGEGGHLHLSSPRVRGGKLAALAPGGGQRRPLSPYEQDVAKALHPLLPPLAAGLVASFLCCHRRCQLTSSPVCCICADLRSYASAYEKYVDGVGIVSTASRSEFYCGECRGAAGTAAGEAAARHNRLVVASLGPAAGA